LDFYPFELHLLHVEIYFTDKNKVIFLVNIISCLTTRLSNGI